MIFQFQHHYTLEEARQLLPQIRKWLEALDENRHILESDEGRFRDLLADGCDVGGKPVNRRIKAYARIKTLLHEFKEREILIKDLRRGLIDFPSLMHGREVFLCWERDEEDIEFWHDLDVGYDGREPL